MGILPSRMTVHCCVYVWYPMRPERAAESLELELQVVVAAMSVLEVKPLSSETASGTLDS